MSVGDILDNWRNRPRHEQWILGLLAISSALLLIFILLIKPVGSYYQDAERNLESARAEALAVSAALREVSRLQSRDITVLPEEPGGLKQFFSNSASSAKLKLSDLSFNRTGFVVLSVSEAEPYAAFQWLNQLISRHDLLVSQATIDVGEKKSLLNMELVFELPGQR